jgi:hypothetical protein
MARKVVLAIARSGHDIDAHAERIIKEFQPEVLGKIKPFDVERFFDCELEQLTKVKPDFRELSYGIHGYTDITLMECVISIELADDESQRRFLRSTEAHEIGHCIQHVPEFRFKREMMRFTQRDEQATLRMHREDTVPVYRNPEWQAWRFGSALLINTPSVMTAILAGCSVLDMAEAFDVHPAFVASRLRGLKVLDKVVR